MSKFNCAVFTVLSCIILFNGKSSAQYPAHVKIMTYNIQAENATHTGGDYSDIATVIKAIKPNICGMQKVDSLSAAKPVDVLKYLGQQATMTPTFSMSYQKNSGAYGIGFLTDSVPKSSRRLAIPKGSASEDRSALEIGITLGGEKVRVIVTHLGYDNATVRTTQVGQIIPWIDAGGAATDPVVIMADFNAGPTESSMQLLTDAGFEFVKGKNGVILDSTQKINHILFRPASRFKINDAGNPTYAASNRNPLWADMELLNPVTTAAAPTCMHVLPSVTRLQHSGNLLSYHLTTDAVVSLQVYNATGSVVQSLINNKQQVAGVHTIAVSNKHLPAGCYHCVLSVGGCTYAVTTSIVR